MSIFNNYREHGYNAYLNWMFDDGNGRLDALPAHQRAWDLKTMGSSYLKNAETSLALLIAEGGHRNEADVMIFPILFNIWHGIELLLKSGNTLCDIYLNEPEQNYSKHKIDVYADLFKSKMKKLGFTHIEKTHLKEMLDFIDECKQHNAHFDFARYTEQANGDKQFYNTPDDSGFLQNVCVDMIELYKTLTEMNKKFPDCVDYLFDYLKTYGEVNQTHLTEEDMEGYSNITGCFDFLDKEQPETYQELLREYVSMIIENESQKYTPETSSTESQPNK